MKKMMAWLSTFSVVLCLVFCAVPARVKADETLPDKEALIKLIAPDERMLFSRCSSLLL